MHKVSKIKKGVKCEYALYFVEDYVPKHIFHIFFFEAFALQNTYQYSCY